MRRVQYVPDPVLAEIAPRITQTVRALADSIEPPELPSLLDAVAWSHASVGFDRMGASEGTLWIRDAARENLVPVFNTGPNADKFVFKHMQPLDKGIISMVFATEIPFVESNIYANQKQDGTLDRTLGVLTCSMVAVPFGYAQTTRGVVSAVILKPADSSDPDPAPFSHAAIHDVQMLSETLERFVDLELLKLCLGTEHG